MTTRLDPTGYGWLVYQEHGRLIRGALFVEGTHYIGCVEPVGKRFKAKLNARLVRSEAGPAGIYPTLETAVKALEEKA